jgi:hypothetical protein
MGRSNDDKATKAEDTFSTLLQRIQRQYHAGSGNNNHYRPPDEAAHALGKGLAQLLLKLSSQKEEEGQEGNKKEGDNDYHNAALNVKVVPKQIQEKALVALADRRLNPSVCQGFFDILLQSCQDALMEDEKYEEQKLLPCFVNMDAWLPAWILYTERKALSERDEFDHPDDYDDDWLVVSLSPLSCMIRAYARFVQLKICQRCTENNTIRTTTTETDQEIIHPPSQPVTLTQMQQYSDNRSLAEPSSLVGIVAKTYCKLQTQVGRLAMLHEFTKNAFQPHFRPPVVGCDPSSLSMYKLVLTPLMACSVLSASSTTLSLDLTSTSVTEAILCMEGIWRQAYLAVLEDNHHDSEIPQDGGDTNQQHRTKPKDSNPSNQAINASYIVSSVYKINIVRWLTENLDLFLISIPSRPSQAKVTCKELAHRWLVTVLDLGAFVAQQVVEWENGTMTMESNSALSVMAEWFEGVISGTLLRVFSFLPSYRISMENIWDPLRTLTAIHTAERPFSLLITFKLATMAVSHPIVEEVSEILNLLAISIEPATTDGVNSRKTQQKLHPTTFAILRGLGSIFLRDKYCALATTNLLETLSRTNRVTSHDTGGIPTISDSGTNRRHTRNDCHDLSNVIQLLEKEQTTADGIVRFVSTSNYSVDGTPSLSPIQQSGLLMFGIGLFNSARRRECAYEFFKNVLLRYPHVGVSPVMVDSINAAAIRGDGDSMMDHINFLCEHLAHDSQCAREIWNLLGVELMRDAIPGSVRASIIRTFPKICKSNKKLYKRIIESMGHSLLSSSSDESLDRSMDDGRSNLEIRLAIAATTADLAKEDLIRDPTDVIGWMQDFISDTGWVRSVSTRDRQNDAGRAALVHYAILSLHYLVMAQELDYKLVLVVLSKRLCSIHDMREVSKLPPLVLESLILLLGDGELEDEESDGDRPKPIGPSPHAVKSVDTLINLWDCEALRLLPHTDPMTRTSIEICRRRIFSSLAKYSFEALGLEDEAIKAVTTAAVANDATISKSSTADRYGALKHLIEDGVAMRQTSTSISDVSEFAKNGRQGNENTISSFVSFTSKILKMEEDCLGSSLWQKRASSRKEACRKENERGLQSAVQSGITKSIPSPASIIKTYKENKCQATALAALVAFEGKPMTLLDDLARDATSDPLDPVTQTFYIQSWVNGTRNLLNELVSSISISESLDKMLLNVQQWRLDNPDATYMCLSCIAMHIPHVLGPYGDHSSYVKDISDDVWEAYNAHVFDDPDVARLCLAFVAVCDLSSGSTDRLRDIVSTLEATVTGYGGQPSFGAFFGLGVIAQSCATYSKQESEVAGLASEDLVLVTQIAAFLVSQLHDCITGSHEALASLVKCIKRGEITPEVIEALTTMKKKSLKISSSKMKAAKSIFISFAVCLPAITKVNDEILLGIYCLLESLSWGCGKGFCLPAVLHCCRGTGLFEASEIETMYQKYAKLFESSMENGTDGLDDIFYAVTAIQSKAIPFSIRKFMVGSRNLFDESGRALSLVSAVVSISSIPCLGRGASSFLTRPCLAENVSEDDIAGVVESVSEGKNLSKWNLYSQMANILMGFLVSLGRSMNSDNPMDDGLQLNESTATQTREALQLPSAHPGTALEVVMTVLQEQVKSFSSASVSKTNPADVILLECLEGLSLPGQFADFVEIAMRHCDEATKTACMKIIVSQVRGRPRAVFDGREFVNLTLKMSRMPISTLKEFLGEDVAAELFLDSFGDMLAKYVSQTVEEAAEGVFRYCMNAIGQNVRLVVKFLHSLKYLLHRASVSKAFRFSPKAVSFIQLMLLRRVFAGLRDALRTSDGDQGLEDQRTVLKAYADCLSEIPFSVLQETDFFTVKELDGFVGESLRVEVIMLLVRDGVFESASRAHGEIASAIAWICRQIVACNDEIFSCIILRVACTIAEATAKESSERMKELFLSLLDNFLMVSSTASFVGLEVLAALAFQWSHGNGSNGDLSLLFAFGSSIERWQDLSPDSLKDVFRLAVHDLPFNLARYVRREKLSKVFFNRLWRIYIKWGGQGATEEALRPLRITLISCRDGEITTTEDLIPLVLLETENEKSQLDPLLAGLA